ncbi:MAG: hypothetical protein AAGD25_33005 [Cyanobacteria bacterium P01_F01_bin.150]
MHKHLGCSKTILGDRMVVDVVRAIAICGCGRVIAVWWWMW